MEIPILRREHDEALLDFYIHMFINKALAIAIIYQFARLYKAME